MEPTFPKTELNQVKRVPNRGHYDHQTVHQIIDSARIAHIGISGEHFENVIIPMLHARIGNSLILHGANSSRLMKYLAGDNPVCACFSIVDGLVLAKSLFHHSMNYRSVVAYGRGKKIIDATEITSALKAISDKVMPGRWEDARLPNEKELAATMLVKVEIESASAKIRTGPPSDDPDDLDLPIWSGVVSISEQLGEPETDETSTSLPVPEYVKNLGQA